MGCIGCQGAPDRVHVVEPFLDPEVQTDICDRFGLLDGLPRYRCRSTRRITTTVGHLW